MTIVQNMATNETDYRCTICGNEVKLLKSMKRHIRTKQMSNTTPVFKCPHCYYSTNYREICKDMSRAKIPQLLKDNHEDEEAKHIRLEDLFNYPPPLFAKGGGEILYQVRK